jgi:hypothetical protein
MLGLQGEVRLLFSVEHVVIANGYRRSIRVTIAVAAIGRSLHVKGLLVHVRVDIDGLDRALPCSERFLA